VPVVVRLPIHGNLMADRGIARASSAVRRPELARHVPTGWGVVCYDRGNQHIVPHKRLWRLTDGDGGEIACELETLTTNRVLLVVKKNGTPIVTETFADKRDALARSVGIYKEMKPAADS
jgi:hypothetical protein